MKKLVIVIIFFLVLSCNAKNYFLTLGIAYPLVTNKSKTDSVNVNLALIQNSVGNVRGINLCGISAICKGNVKGCQSSLIYSQIDKDLKGINSAAVNIVNGTSRGVLLGLGNLNGGDVYGVQLSSSVNFVIGKVTGYQQSSLFNMVGDDFSGLQTAGLCCITGKNFRGAQFGSIFNFTGKEMRGFQFGSVNIAGKQNGFQLGYLNVTQENNGFQTGLVNIAEKQNGIPLGIVNISDDGNISWQNYLSSFAEFTLAARFETGNFYSTLEAGAGKPEIIDRESVMTGFHYGYGIPLDSFKIEADFGYLHLFYIMNDNDEKIYNSSALQIRIAGNYRIFNWLSVFAGFGGNSYNTQEDKEKFYDEFLIFGGVNLF